LAVDGVDGCWIGPQDLAASMGTHIGSEAHEKAMLRIGAACQKTGKVPVTFCAGQAERRLKQGFLFVTPLVDTFFIGAGTKEVLEKLKSW